MNKTAKIYTAGHQGLVGSALVPNLQAKGHTKLLTRTHAELDLTNQAASEAFFVQEQPDFVNAAAKELGMQIRWKGQGVEEKGYLISFPFKGEAGRGMGEPGEAPHSPSPPAGKGRGEGAPGPRHSRESGTPDRPIVAVDPRYFRPTEVETLLGDAAKAKEKLGWTPKIRFQELVAEMVREDLKSAERDELVKKHGYAAFDYNE